MGQNPKKKKIYFAPEFFKNSKIVTAHLLFRREKKTFELVRHRKKYLRLLLLICFLVRDILLWSFISEINYFDIKDILSLRKKKLCTVYQFLFHEFYQVRSDIIKIVKISKIEKPEKQLRSYLFKIEIIN